MRPWRKTLLALPLAVMACGSDGAGLNLPVPSAAKRDAPETVAVAGGAVVVGGPAGYCIDKPGSKLRGDTAFVLIGNCASVSGDGDAPSPAAPGLLTASVDAPLGDTPPSAEELLAFLTSKDGKGTLARDGLPPSITVLNSEVLNKAVLLHINDTSPEPTPGLETTYWRGLFFQNGRLVTVTVNGFTSAPVSADEARAKLVAFIARIREESPDAAPDATPEQRRGIFRGIFE